MPAEAGNTLSCREGGEYHVMPAEAGIQGIERQRGALRPFALGPRLRGGDAGSYACALIESASVLTSRSMCSFSTT